MTTYETFQLLGSGLGGFLFGIVTSFVIYYTFIRNASDYEDRLLVGLLVAVGLISLFQGVLLTAFLTGPR